MIIYYSGDATRANPEIVLGDKANIMLTYIDYCKMNQPSRRFRDIIKKRRQHKKSKKKGKKS